MTDPALEGDAARRPSAPLARISRGALARNAADLIAASSARPDSAGVVLDLRRDAWGHGLAEVSGVLRGRAVEVIVDAGAEPVVIDGLSIAGPTSGVSERTAADTRALFGLGGAASASSGPVMSLRGSVISTKALRTGEGVSYGYSYRATADTRIALVTGGYAQGIPRALGNRGSVRGAGRSLPIIGRVAMDVCVVDIDDAELDPGDELVFFGGADGPALRDWELASSLGADELIATVGLRAPREYVA